MADPPRYPDTDDDRDLGADRASKTGGEPRRVWVVGIIIAIGVVLLVVLHVTGILGPGAH